MSSVDFSRLSSVRNLLNLSQDFDNHKKVVAHGPYGVHDTMRVGMRSIAHELAPQHPLQLSLQTV